MLVCIGGRQGTLFFSVLSMDFAVIQILKYNVHAMIVVRKLNI